MFRVLGFSPFPTQVKRKVELFKGRIRVLTLPQYSYLFFEQNAFMEVFRLSSTWPLLK